METPGASSEPTIDRLAPARRPPGRPIGYQRWRSLLFLHWPVPAEVLRPLVPDRLAIDLYDGVAYVGLVPFLVREARPALAPEAVALDFLETNVRTYVHIDGKDPGVYFFSLDAGSLLAVVAARAGLGLPYFPARMRMTRRGSSVEYRAQRRTGTRPRLAVVYETGEHLGAAAPGTLEHFLIERYFLHNGQAGGVLTIRVHHRPYPLRRARVTTLRDELIAADGLPEPNDPPPLVHYAAGVDVEVFPPRRRSS
jgi:uncharacterized protein YqjF (DUF2071 family)